MATEDGARVFGRNPERGQVVVTPGGRVWVQWGRPVGEEPGGDVIVVLTDGVSVPVSRPSDARRLARRLLKAADFAEEPSQWFHEQAAKALNTPKTGE